MQDSQATSTERRGLPPEASRHSGAPGHARARGRSSQALGAAFWVVLLGAGAVQTWHTRHRIFSDGISYLDIATNYARGDWAHALNEYWSPLYSWIVALVLRIFRPAPYWQVSTLHLVNFAAFCGSLFVLELLLCELTAFGNRMRAAAGADSTGLSERTIRIAGYSCLLLAGLYLVGIGYCSPDMIAMGIVLLVSYLLLRIERGAGTGTFAAFGIVLGLGYLSRAAFLPLIPVYLAVVAILLRRRGRRLARPLAWTSIAAVLVMAPFILALSAAKGHFTLGSAGRLNYGWEVAGAARSIHWQGEPFDIGAPRHPTRKISERPTAYEFGSPVAGTYPPWYDPSYWYDGIAPHLKLRSQLAVLWGDLRWFLILFLASPVTLPVAGVILFAGWKRWLRLQVSYWFLVLPMLAYVGFFCIVFLDRRYVAGSLVVLWLSLLCAVRTGAGKRAALSNAAIQIFCLVFCLALLAGRFSRPAARAFSDLTHGSETEQNVGWLLSQGFRRLGVGPGERVAYIGQAIDAEWARLAGARIVAEIPVKWDRYNALSRVVRADESEVTAFWRSSPEHQARVLDAFRKAGATLVVADKAPPEAAGMGWRQVLPPGTAHLPTDDTSQFMFNISTAFLYLDNSANDHRAHVASRETIHTIRGH